MLIQTSGTDESRVASKHKPYLGVDESIHCNLPHGFVKDDHLIVKVLKEG